MELSTLMWLILALLFLAVEVGHPGLFFFLPFGFAAFATAFSAIWIDSIIWQNCIFLATSISLFLFLHRYLNIRSLIYRDEQPTNLDALIGQVGIVIKPIAKQGTGYITVNGQEWLARSHDGEGIEQGASVTILLARGIHLIVQKPA